MTGEYSDDPLFDMPRVPRLNVTCPKCGHAVCGSCGIAYAEIQLDDGLHRQRLGETCCRCNTVWNEGAFDHVQERRAP